MPSERGHLHTTAPTAVLPLSGATSACECGAYFKDCSNLINIVLVIFQRSRRNKYSPLQDAEYWISKNCDKDILKKVFIDNTIGNKFDIFNFDPFLRNGLIKIH